jgi:hypothetical protein
MSYICRKFLISNRWVTAAPLCTQEKWKNLNDISRSVVVSSSESMPAWSPAHSALLSLLLAPDVE